METSARNVFSGKVVAVNAGAVNDEVELAIDGGINIVASITKVSTNNLGLKPGASALALIKASFVLLMNDADKYLLYPQPVCWYGKQGHPRCCQCRSYC